MAGVREQIAYLRGLIEGVDGGSTPVDGRQRGLWQALVSALEGLADETQRLQQGLEEDQEYLEVLDADLGDLEEEVYGPVPVSEDLIEIECPRCGADVYLEQSAMLEGDRSYLCPECGEELVHPVSDGKVKDGAAPARGQDPRRS